MFLFFNDTATTEIYTYLHTLSLHDALPIYLDPALGGKCYGQFKLALMNEIIGRCSWAPTVFGCAAPDSGNADILAMYGSDAQKQRYLQPLLDGEICSCFSMTEPQAGRSEEHTSELQSLMRISYAVFCLKKQNLNTT